MMNEVIGAFWRWVEDEREKRQLSYRRIETTIGPPSGKLRKRASAGLAPTMENCRAIAEAFELPLDAVLRRANLLPADATRPELRELYDYAERLSAANLGVLTVMARALAHEQARTGSEQGHFRVIGMPDLPERIYAPEDVDRFLEALTPEERALLAAALARSSEPEP